MRSESGKASLDAVLDEAIAARRGAAFERLLADAFRRARFEVTQDSLVAQGRQTDFFARYGDRSLIVEAKCLRKKADVSHIDDLRARLDGTPADVVGALFSVAGFTGPARVRVEAHRGRPILLFDRDAIELVVDAPEALDRLIEDKLEALVEHGRAVPGSAGIRIPARQVGTRLQAAATGVDLADGPAPWVTTSGGYASLVFAPKLADPDWVTTPGRGVALDLQLSAGAVEEISNALEVLSDFGWADESYWSIEQSGRSWHGIGAESAAQALSGWLERYHAIPKAHHTEIFSWYGACDLGFYTLNASIEADAARRVWDAEVSFQLSGTPLDLRPWSELVRRLHAPRPAFFRPGSSERVVGRSGAARVPVQPVGRLLAVKDIDEHSGAPWVTGVVARNPYAGAAASQAPDGWPEDLRERELLFCDLRSWHPAADSPRDYEIVRFEVASTSSVRVVRIVVDWAADTAHTGPKIRVPGERWTPEASEQDHATDPKESPRGEAEGGLRR